MSFAVLLDTKHIGTRPKLPRCSDLFCGTSAHSLFNGEVSSSTEEPRSGVEEAHAGGSGDLGIYSKREDAGVPHQAPGECRARGTTSRQEAGQVLLPRRRLAKTSIRTRSVWGSGSSSPAQWHRRTGTTTWTCVPIHRAGRGQYWLSVGEAGNSEAYSRLIHGPCDSVLAPQSSQKPKAQPPATRTRRPAPSPTAAATKSSRTPWNRVQFQSPDCEEPSRMAKTPSQRRIDSTNVEIWEIHSDHGTWSDVTMEDQRGKDAERYRSSTRSKRRKRGSQLHVAPRRERPNWSSSCFAHSPIDVPSRDFHP